MATPREMIWLPMAYCDADTCEATKVLEPAAKDCTEAGEKLLGLVAVVGAGVTAGCWDCPARLGAGRGELSSLAAEVALVPGTWVVPSPGFAGGVPCDA